MADPNSALSPDFDQFMAGQQAPATVTPPSPADFDAFMDKTKPATAPPPAIPAIDPRSGMAIPQTQAPSAIPQGLVSRPDQTYYPDQGAGPLMRGRQPVPVNDQQRGDAAARQRIGPELQKGIDSSPITQYVSKTANQGGPVDDLEALGSAAGVAALGPLATVADSVAVRQGLYTLKAGIGGYFTYELAKGATPELQSAYADFQQGRYNDMFQHMGVAGVQGFAAYVAANETLKQMFPAGFTFFDTGVPESAKPYSQQNPYTRGSAPPVEVHTGTEVPAQAETSKPAAPAPEPVTYDVTPPGSPDFDTFMGKPEAAEAQPEPRPAPEKPAAETPAKPAAAKTPEPVAPVSNIADPSNDFEKPAPKEVEPRAFPKLAIPPEYLGNLERVKTPAGYDVVVQHAIVPREQINGSHDFAGNPNPAFMEHDPTMQPRKRDSAASQMQVQDIYNNLDGKRLQGSPLTSGGSPITDDEGFLLSGNGRFAAIDQSYSDKHPNSALYKQTIEDNPAKYGITGTFQPGDEPVHIRILRSLPPGISKEQFALDSNESDVATMSAAEQAKADARRLDPELLAKLVPNDEGKLGTPDNRDFIRGFQQQVVGKNNNKFMTADGTLSTEGIARVRNAVFHAAYNDTSAVTKLAEDPDPNIKNILNGMQQAAPAFAVQRQQIAAGNLHSRDLSADVAAAAKKLSALRDAKTSVPDYLDQRGLFGADMSPIQLDLLKTMHDNARSPNRLGEILNTYVHAVNLAGNPKQGDMFADPEVAAAGAPSKADILNAAIEHVRELHQKEKADVQPAVQQSQPDSQPDRTPRPQSGAAAVAASANDRQARARPASGDTAAVSQPDSPRPRPGVEKLAAAKAKRAATVASNQAKIAKAKTFEEPGWDSVDTAPERYNKPAQQEIERHLEHAAVLLRKYPVNSVVHLNQAAANAADAIFGSQTMGRYVTGDDLLAHVEQREREVLAFLKGDRARRNAERLFAAFKQQASAGNHLLMVRGAGPMRSKADVRRTMLHEGFHWVQDTLFGPIASHLGPDAQTFLDDPLARKARATLGMMNADPHRAAVEVSVRLFSDQRTQLGLNESESLQLTDKYLKLLSNRYGSERIIELGRIFDALRKGEPYESRTKSFDTGRSGPGVDEFSEARRRPPERTGGVPEGIRGDAGGGPEERRSAASFLAGGISRLFDDVGPKGNYSGLGALKDKFVRNLSQLEAANPTAHTAALEAAGSRGATKALLAGAVPQIENTLKAKGGPSWDEMRTALVESRLQGIRQRWDDLAAHALRAGEKGLAQDFDGGGMMTLLQAVEGKRDIPQDVWQTALALYQDAGLDHLPKQSESDLFPEATAADYADRAPAIASLRDFLHQTFSDAGKSVERVLTPEDYGRITAHPAFAPALNQYKSLIEQPLAENHAANEGVFSTALGPLKTYYPLIPMGKEESGGAGRRVAYRKPQNIANEFATGISPLGFDTGMTPFAERLATAIRGNNKAALMQTLKDQGVLQPIGPNDKRQVMQWKGDEYAAARVEMKPSRLLVADGKAIHKPAEMALIPQVIAAELAPLLEQGMTAMPPSVLNKLLTKLNSIALAGPLDMVFHSANLIGALVGNTPFAGTDILSKSIGNTPATKVFTSIINLVNTNPTSDESLRDLSAMAKLGLIPDRYGSETMSKRFAAQTGAHRPVVDIGRVSIPYNLGPVLYGPKGLDVRARLLMYRIGKNINPDATPQEMHQFVTQLGGYVRSLEASLERGLKDSQAAPFATAGMTFLRNGITAVLGNSPFPTSSLGMPHQLKYKLYQQLSGGMVGLVAMWVMAHRALTGKWPWDDAKARFLKLPVPPDVRNSKLGRQLWGNQGSTAYADLSFFSHGTVRGARALGIAGAFDARAKGGTGGQILEGAEKDMFNAAMGPLATGPAIRAGSILATGHETHITSLRDHDGKFNPQFMDAADNKVDGAASLRNRAAEAVMSMNGFFGKVGAATGFGHQAAENPGANKWLRMVTDMTMPGLLGYAQDPGKQTRYMHKEAAAIAHANRKGRL